MNTLLYLVLTLVLLSIMVVIHELGHFLFAKLFKVTVLEFSIGMGPAIFTTKNKRKKNKSDTHEIADEFHSHQSPNPDFQNANSDENGENDPSVHITNVDASRTEEEQDNKTAFSIRALPIGGYVSMAGEDEASTDVNAFCNKPVWQRFIITVAGPVMNILLGFLCMFSLVGVECIQTYNATGKSYFASNTIYEFREDSVSDKCEEPLMAGDKVIKVDGIRVHTGNELVYEIINSGFESIDLVVIRNGETVTLHDVSFPVEEISGVKYGNYDFIMLAEKANVGTVAKHAFFRSFSTIKVITDSLGDLIKGRYGAEAVSGPIGMAGAVGEATKSGIDSLIYLFTLITMNLGVFNLLPLPALDGGRIIFLIIEGIIRRPVKKEFEQAVNTAGIMILLALMLLVTFKDIANLF